MLSVDVALNSPCAITFAISSWAAFSGVPEDLSSLDSGARQEVGIQYISEKEVLRTNIGILS